MEDKIKKNLPRNRSPKNWTRYMVYVVVFAALLLGYNIYQARDNLSYSGGSTNLKAGNVKSLAGEKGSTNRYNEIVEQNNQVKQVEAEENGQSFMPTMVAEPVIIDDFVDEPISKQPQSSPPSQEEQRNAGRVSQTTVAVENQNMLAAMDAYLGQWRHGQTVSTTVYASLQDINSTSERINAVTTPLSGVLDILDSPLKVGSILYSISLLDINSDQPSTPVVAEVLSGKNAKGRFLGGFTRENDMLVLQFSQFVDVDGNVTQVDAYAIDPKTKSAAVRTSIDNHTIKRWGGLIAASFLEGLGTAISQTSGTTIESNGAVISTQEKYSSSEQAKIAAGKIGEKLGGHMESQFNIPPTVKFKPDTAIGVLVVGV